MKIQLNYAKNYGMYAAAANFKATNNVSAQKNEQNSGARFASYPANYYLSNSKVSFNGKYSNYEKYNWELERTVKIYTDEESEDPIKWAQKWDETKRKKELDFLCEQECEGKWFKGKIKNKYNEILEDEKSRVLQINKTVSGIENRIKKLEDLGEDNAAVQKQIAEEKAKLQNLSAAAEKIKKFKEDPNRNIDATIAGYKAVKDVIASEFISKLALEQAGMDVDFPNSILFYGPIGTGKTTLAKAIANETGCYAVEINPKNSEFETDVLNKIAEASARYTNENKRTIIVVNEINKFTKENNDEINDKNIETMKDVLDACSKLPDKSDHEAAAATTFFFTTNNPMEISDEILFREGKIAERIPVAPAEKENFKAVLKHHIKKADPDKQDFDYETVINYDDYAELLEPNKTEGAYSNSKIAKIVEKAYGKYIACNKEKSFDDCLLERFDKAPRDILPKRLVQFEEAMAQICEDPEDFEGGK